MGSKLKTISITSGKGGVGKTTVSVNLATTLASLGHKVALADLDLGLGNVCVLLGLEPEKTLEDVILGDSTMSEVGVQANEMLIFPGASGSAYSTELPREIKEKLIEGLKEVCADFDYLILDTGAGIGDNTLTFLESSDEVVLVVTPEPTSMADGYALLKVLLERKSDCVIKFVVNMCNSILDAKDAEGRMKLALKRFLNSDMAYLGFIKKDSGMIEASKKQKALVTLSPRSKTAQRFKDLGNRICGKKTGGFFLFFKR
jgi:flagellar biosynthesis protein FlhG